MNTASDVEKGYFIRVIFIVYICNVRCSSAHHFEEYSTLTIMHIKEEGPYSFSKYFKDWGRGAEESKKSVNICVLTFAHTASDNMPILYWQFQLNDWT